MSIEVAMQFGKPKQAAAAGTGPGMTLLWENSNPTANFTAQTISLDLSEYDAAYIVYKSSTGNILWSGIILKDDALNYPRFITNSGANTRWFSRTIRVNDTGAVFADCGRFTQGTSGTTTTNDSMIPYRIYGVKFG